MLLVQQHGRGIGNVVGLLGIRSGGLRVKGLEDDFIDDVAALVHDKHAVLKENVRPAMTIRLDAHIAFTFGCHVKSALAIQAWAADTIDIARASSRQNGPVLAAA